ncbi:MAG: esterase family protein [Silvibacterium sp.]|nr:esterase family protein [Silvibacterium sp.]
MERSPKTRRGKGKRGLATQISAQAHVDPLLIEALPPDAPPHPRVHVHRQFISRFLSHDRDVSVYVPPGYDEEPGRNYPVLYLQDGQNLFDPRTSFVRGRTWQVADTADSEIAAGTIEPLIIVGIANTGEHRLAEYTPTRDWKMGGGDADKYGKLLIYDLLPWIGTKYRVRHGLEHTALGGSSLGGLVTLYLGLKYSEIFGKLAVMSPSVWWNHKSIVGFVNEKAPSLRHRPRIWLDVGDGEGRRTIADTDLLSRRLEAWGWHPEKDLRYERVPGGTHDETAWSQRVAPMLRFLFSNG